MRTIAQIQAAIIAEKNTIPELAVLNDTSPTAIWLLWTYVVAAAIWTHESIFEAFRKAVEAIAARSSSGNLRWYQHISMQYQHGYMLLWNSTRLKYEYSVVDESAKIIALAAVTESVELVTIKVAKKSNGMAQKLTSLELASFGSYMNRVKIAGTFLNIISEDADKLKVYATVKYDGTLPLSVVQAQTEAAINSYILSLPFNGTLLKSALSDAIQSISAVKDVRIDDLQAKSQIASAFTTIDMDYDTYAGYLTIDNAFPLSATITYIAI